MPLKVGDKIKIKGPITVGSNLLSKDEPENEYSKTFKDIIAILKSSMAQQDKLKWCSVVFNVLDSWYALDSDEELRACKGCKQKLIPSLHNLVEKAKIEYMPDFFDYYKRAYAFAARRDFECFVDYMEWNEPKKVYANRRSLLAPYVKALGELPFDKQKQAFQRIQQKSTLKARLTSRTLHFLQLKVLTELKSQHFLMKKQICF